jgi:hypothetical protein
MSTSSAQNVCEPCALHADDATPGEQSLQAGQPLRALNPCRHLEGAQQAMQVRRDKTPSGTALQGTLIQGLPPLLVMVQAP